MVPPRWPAEQGRPLPTRPCQMQAACYSGNQMPVSRGLAVRLFLGALTSALVMWLLVGCATSKWSHPTAGEQQFKADDSECEKLAAASLGGLGYPPRAGTQPSQAGVYQSMRVNQAYERCMMGKGWVKP